MVQFLSRFFLSFVLCEISRHVTSEGEQNEYVINTELESSHPTSMPSFIFDNEAYTVVQRIGGASPATSGVALNFWNIPSPHAATYTDIYPEAYLTVEVYMTDFSEDDEYVDAIRVNGVIISSFCDPGVDSGGEFYTCLSIYDITDMVPPNGIVEVVTTATSEVACCGYSGNPLYVKYTITYKDGIRDNTPQDEEDDLIWEGGTNDFNTGLVHTFDDLDAGYDYKLTVAVVATDYEVSEKYIRAIIVNGQSALAEESCDIGSSCGDHGYYKCLAGRDVSEVIVRGRTGGYLKVTVLSTDNLDECPYRGYLLYARYILSKTAKNEGQYASSLPIIYTVIMIGLFAIAITVYCIIKRRKNMNERRIHDNATVPAREPRQLPQSTSISLTGAATTYAIPAPAQAHAVQLTQSYALTAAPSRSQHNEPPALAVARISSQQDNVPVAGYARPI